MVLVKLIQDFVKKHYFIILLALFIALIVFFLARIDKRVSINDALKSIEDSSLKSCIKSSAEDYGYNYIYQLKKIQCPIKLDKKSAPLFITDLNGLEQFKYIKELDLSHSRVKSLSPISNLDLLESLLLEDAGISSLFALRDLKNLNSLNLANNSIEDLSPLESLEELQILDLRKNKISSINTIANFKKLKSLNLQSNKIQDISSLKQLSKVEILNLDSNKISNLYPLISLKKLSQLYLRDNQIENIEILKYLTKLRIIDLSRNKIKDVSSLSNMFLVGLDLEQNKLEQGVGDLFTYLNDPKKTSYVQSVFLDISFNDSIKCAEIEQLRIKLARIKAEFHEPASCADDLKTRRRYRYRPKKSVWKKFMDTFNLKKRF